MASGIPLVTTRVGQATELVEHGRTGWLVDVDDVEGLAHWTIEVQEGGIAEVVSAARIAAERHALVRLDPLWSELLDGFVERRPS